MKKIKIFYTLAVVFGLLVVSGGIILAHEPTNPGDGVSSNCEYSCPVIHYEWVTTEWDACPEGYSVSIHDETKCVKHIVGNNWDVIGRTSKTINHSVDVQYDKSSDPNKCHRPSDKDLKDNYGMSDRVKEAFKRENNEWLAPIAAAPDGYYLEGGMCYPKIPVCTNENASNYDDNVDETEIADDSVCIYPTAETATIEAKKIVCENESDLPNWGEGDADITSSTASTFLASHQNCKEVPWTFEWIESASEPSPKTDDAVSLDGWTSFSGGSDDTIPVGKKIWVREQFDGDYIPFTGANTDKDVSAELYCDNDVLNYDNLEYINTQEGATYYCVALNVLKEKPVEPEQCNVVSDITNITQYGANAVETWVHPGWIQSIASSVAKWVWITPKVSYPDQDEKESFTKQFTVGGNIVSADIQIAADNLFFVEINGEEVGNLDRFYDGYISDDNFSSLTGPVSVKDYLVDGPNTIKITVKNRALAGSTPEENPAGLLYDLKIVSDECSSEYTPEEPTDGTWTDWTPTTSECGQGTFTQTRTCEGALNGGTCDGSENGTVQTQEQPRKACALASIDVCPNIAGDQTVVPQNKVLRNGNCVPRVGRSGSLVQGGGTQGQVLGASTSCGLYIDKYLRKGYNNDIDSVKKIQKFLNDYMSAGITEDGIFGEQTEIALKAFQLKHADKILIPWNIEIPTGIFYLTTQTEVNNIMCPDLDLGVPSDLIPFSQNTGITNA